MQTTHDFLGKTEKLPTHTDRVRKLAKPVAAFFCKGVFALLFLTVLQTMPWFYSAGMSDYAKAPNWMAVVTTTIITLAIGIGIIGIAWQLLEKALAFIDPPDTDNGKVYAVFFDLRGKRCGCITNGYEKMKKDIERAMDVHKAKLETPVPTAEAIERSPFSTVTLTVKHLPDGADDGVITNIIVAEVATYSRAK